MKIVKAFHSVEEYNKQCEDGVYREVVKLDDLVIDKDRVYIQSEPLKNVVIDGVLQDEEVIFRLLDADKNDFMILITTIIIRQEEIINERWKRFFKGWQILPFGNQRHADENNEEKEKQHV